MDFIRSYPIPFYLAYGDGENEKGIWRPQNGREDTLADFEYLQRIHPACLAQYREKIIEVLNSLDYEGSMIYDEYPDKFCIIHLARSISHMLKKDLSEKDLSEKGILERNFSEGSEKDISEQNYLETVIQVLLCDEIYRRRLNAKKKDSYGIWTGITKLYTE